MKTIRRNAASARGNGRSGPGSPNEFSNEGGGINPNRVATAPRGPRCDVRRELCQVGPEGVDKSHPASKRIARCLLAAVANTRKPYGEVRRSMAYVSVTGKSADSVFLPHFECSVRLQAFRLDAAIPLGDMVTVRLRRSTGSPAAIPRTRGRSTGRSTGWGEAFANRAGYADRPTGEYIAISAYRYWDVLQAC